MTTINVKYKDGKTIDIDCNEVESITFSTNAILDKMLDLLNEYKENDVPLVENRLYHKSQIEGTPISEIPETAIPVPIVEEISIEPEPKVEQPQVEQPQIEEIKEQPKLNIFEKINIFKKKEEPIQETIVAETPIEQPKVEQPIVEEITIEPEQKPIQAINNSTIQPQSIQTPNNSINEVMFEMGFDYKPKSNPIVEEKPMVETVANLNTQLDTSNGIVHIAKTEDFIHTEPPNQPPIQPQTMVIEETKPKIFVKRNDDEQVM